jgi:hypothetical protein
MRRYSMPNREAWTKIRPNDERDWHQLHVLGGGYLAAIVICITAIFYLKHKNREDLEHNWIRATALIENVRPKQIGVIDTPIRGAILYRVTVLVKYRSDNGDQERWITVDQRPESLAGAKLQAFRWKGKPCIVRWKPSHPSKVIAEVS